MSSFDFKPTLRRHVSLRHYQEKAEQSVYLEWDVGHLNVLVCIPTGGGKTRLIASIISKHKGAACIFAHRKELVAQIAGTMNEFGIPFRLICDPKDRKAIIAGILRKQGVCFHDTNSPISVASVDTLWRIPNGKHAAQYAKYFASVTLWVCDEAHHGQGGADENQKANKWGKAALLFTNPKVRGLGVTATPARTDGGGLSRETDGIYDSMVMGPTLADLFEDGYLCPYDIVCIKCAVEYDTLAVGASGEFIQAKLVAAEEEAESLVGDIVDNYFKWAAGLKGVCFVSSVAKAEEVAKRFCAAGVPALALSAETEDHIRDSAKADIESGKLMMLVNCDLYGEGTDLPALEVVILGTATNSLPRYMQRVGRLYRLMLREEQKATFDSLDSAGRRAAIAKSIKPRGVLIDHGGHLVRFKGPPEAPHRVWSLGRPGRKSVAGDAVPYRVCANPGLYLTNPAGHTWDSYRKAGWSNEQMLAAGHLTEGPLPCAQPYERIFRICPHCGFYPEVVSRSDPEHVEGDLELLTPEKLAELYATVRQATQTVEQYEQYMASTRVNALAYGANVKRHKERLEALAKLRYVMGYWGGLHKQRGDSDPVLQRRFYHLFGLDVISAQALKRAEAEDLTARITAKLLLDGIGIAEYSQGSTEQEQSA